MGIVVFLRYGKMGKPTLGTYIVTANATTVLLSLSSKKKLWESILVLDDCFLFWYKNVAVLQYF